MAEVTLKDISERIDYGLTTSAVVDGEGPKFLRITDIDSSHISWDSVPRCQATPKDIQKYALENGDIVVARTGASTGRSQWVRVEEPTVFASYLVRFRIRSDYHARFIGYVLSSKKWTDYVSSVAHGKSAQPNMSASVMSDFRFDCPPLIEQEAIAEVLGALDDKIAANTKLADSSLRLAQTLFRAEADSGIEIMLADSCDLLSRGITPKYSDDEESVIVLNQKCVRDQRVSLEPARRTDESKVRLEKELRINDVLVNSTGQGTLGRVARWAYDARVTVDSHITIVRFNSDLVDPVCGGFAMLNSEMAITAMAEGSTGQTELSRVELGKLKLKIPVPENQRKLGKQLANMSAMENSYLSENRELALLRDALLPQLMSGKLKVKAAEKLVASAV